MGLSHSPKLVMSGLIAALDFANIRSYPGTGITVFDLSGQGAHGTINGTPVFVGTGLTSHLNFATASGSNYISSTLSQGYVDCTIIFQPDFTLSTTSNLVGLIASSTSASNLDKSMRFGSANGTGPWTVKSASLDANDWGNTSTTYYINGAPVANGASLSSGWNILGAYRTNQSTFPASFSYFLASGGYSLDARNFQGKIAACYLYNRQLTASEHLQNYNALKRRYGLS